MRSVYIIILFDFYLYLIIWFITKFWLNVGYPQISLSDDEKYAKMLQEEECMCFFYRCFRLFYLSNTSFKIEVGGVVQLFFFFVVVDVCLIWSVLPQDLENHVFPTDDVNQIINQFQDMEGTKRISTLCI